MTLTEHLLAAGCSSTSLPSGAATLSKWNSYVHAIFGTCVLVTQLCLTLCYPMECSLQISFVYGILQARILEWVAISFSRDKVWSEWSEVAQSCLTLCNPMDYQGLPGSSVHGIFQARLLEWVASAFSDIYIYINTRVLFNSSNTFCT